MVEIDKNTFLPSFSITEGAFFLNLRNRVGPLGAAAVLKKKGILIKILIYPLRLKRKVLFS